MESGIKELSEYRYQRSCEDLADARLLLREKSYTSMSCEGMNKVLYYRCRRRKVIDAKKGRNNRNGT